MTSADEGDMEFSAVKFGADKKKKRKKENPAELLEKEKRYQEKMKTLEGTEEGEKLSMQKAWSKALQKAQV